MEFLRLAISKRNWVMSRRTGGRKVEEDKKRKNGSKGMQK